MKSTAVCSSAWSFGHEVEHLGLDRRVEAGRRLVEDQQRGVRRERHRDHDALLHAAGELMRVAAHDRAGIGDLHALERLARALGRPRSPATPSTVNASATCAPTRIDGVQRRAGVLVDHRHRVERGTRAARCAPSAEHVPAGDRDRSRPRRGRCAAGSGRCASAAVDLPQPDSPTSPYDSPRSIANDTPRRTGRSMPRTR